MQSELNELKLPSGPRDHALKHARQAIDARRPPTGDALDEAFAEFTRIPRRTDATHAKPAASFDANEAVQQISAQLKQLDQQRRDLTRLLAALDNGAE